MPLFYQSNIFCKFCRRCSGLSGQICPFQYTSWQAWLWGISGEAESQCVTHSHSAKQLGIVGDTNVIKVEKHQANIKLYLPW